MLRWPEFKNAAPEIAAVGTTLLYNPDAGEVAILATVDARNRPWLAPFCPIFTDRGLYLLAAAHTPKVRHLQSNPRYALHALLGADDLEFQTSGSVRCVDDDTERIEVIAAIPFPSFDQTDPIFELLIERALTVIWPEPGKRRELAWTVN